MKKTLTLLVLCCSGLLYSQSITDNLIAHYEFTNGSITDISGNGNDAINVGSTVTTGVSGTTNEALALVSGNHIILPSGMFLKPALSISVWFKTNVTGGIIGYQNKSSTSTPNQYVPIAYVGTDNKIQAGYWSGVQRNLNGRNVNYADNNWHHLVVTVKPGKQTLYIDGTLAGSANVGHTILSGMTFNQIGRAYTKGWSKGNTSGWSSFFGSIDKVRVYDAELSASLVTEMYDLEVTGTVVTGLSSLSGNETLSIYPNPASSVINTEEGQIQIIDALGNFKVNTFSEGQVDISSIESGMYIVIQNNKRTTLVIE